MEPVEVSDDALLPLNTTDVSELMPAYENIPEEFKAFPPRTKWNELFSDMLFKGVTIQALHPKAGIDAKKAWRHIRAVAASRMSKHEHKTAACAYLMSLWFDDIEYSYTYATTPSQLKSKKHG